MPIALALISLSLALCGVAISVAGVIDAVDGRPAAAAIAITIAFAVFYGTYLFARTSRNARRAGLSDDRARRRQARDLRFFAGYILTGIAGLVVLPLPGLAKVFSAAMLVAGTAVAMATRTDPPA